jgi:hypothetical protein
VQGGVGMHDGAICPTCDRNLLLIWRIDLHDPRTQVTGTDVKQPFGHLATVPLYYCWSCGSELVYRIVDDNSINVMRSHGGIPREDFPYPDYPTHYTEQPVRLYRKEELPELVKKYIVEDLDDPIPEDEQQALGEFFGRCVRSTFGDLWWHQFGGEPWLVQGDEEITCPNSTCERHTDGNNMKILAAICNDPIGGLPMIEPIVNASDENTTYNHWVQVVFHICDLCFTINAANRCD